MANPIILFGGSILTSQRCPLEDCLEFPWGLSDGSPRCCCCRCSWVDTLQPEGHTSSALSVLDLQKAALYSMFDCLQWPLGCFQQFSLKLENPKGERPVCCWHAGRGWPVLEIVSKKGQTKGLQREQSLTVYYYRKLNQEAVNAVYTILPLITPPLLHWPLCWLHPLRGGDSSSAITSELSCLLLITMLLLLMAFMTVSVF